MEHGVQSTCVNSNNKGRATEHGVINACFSLQVRNRLTLMQEDRYYVLLCMYVLDDAHIPWHFRFPNTEHIAAIPCIPYRILVRYLSDSSNWPELVSFQELCSLNKYCAMTLLTSLSAAHTRAFSLISNNCGMYLDPSCQSVTCAGPGSD